jgi:hypothetical protein
MIPSARLFNQLAQEIGDCQFFVATDEEKLLNLSKKSLHGPVIHYNSYLSPTTHPVHTKKPPSRYKLGEDVLIDAQLLSKCDYFLHTRSNVAIAVCMFNPDLKNIYFTN